jgi:hypothetical protein
VYQKRLTTEFMKLTFRDSASAGAETP